MWLKVLRVNKRMEVMIDPQDSSFLLLPREEILKANFVIKEHITRRIGKYRVFITILEKGGYQLLHVEVESIAE